MDKKVPTFSTEKIISYYEITYVNIYNVITDIVYHVLFLTSNYILNSQPVKKKCE